MCKIVGDEISVIDIIEGKDINLNGIITKICYNYIEVDWYHDEVHVVKYDTHQGDSIDDTVLDTPTYISLKDINIPENPFNYLKNKMRNEGFHYCFNGYSDWSEIKSKKFQKLKKKYLKAAGKLEKYINKKSD